MKNKIVDLKKELMDSRFALATSQLEDTSVFKKIRKENTGKIGVWDIKKMKIKRGNIMKCENKRQLTTVKVVLRKAERRSFYPLISSLGVKMGVNSVNIIKSPLYFQSRHEISWVMGCLRACFVNIEKTLRHGSGMSMLTNQLVNKSQKIS